MSKSTGVQVGTSGWNDPYWKGPIYAEGLADKDLLSFYGQTFHTVEINNFFYQLPKQATFELWRKTTPDAQGLQNMIETVTRGALLHRKQIEWPEVIVDERRSQQSPRYSSPLQVRIRVRLEGGSV
jgi:hypothetical protein